MLRWIGLSGFVLGFLSAPSALAYGGFAHWKGAPLGLKPYTNLPDLWKSWQPSLQPPVAVITPGFCWGHGCLRLAGLVPPVPLYSGHEAGKDMRKLMCKMTPQRRTYAMLQTARGWAAHNAMDRVVHFTYFDGGTVEKWYYQHMIKEEWADIRIYGYTCEYEFEDYNPYCFTLGDAGIMLLAQKSFRKTRATIDVDPPGTAGPVSPLTELQGLLGGLNTALADIHYSRQDYDLAVETGDLHGWSFLGMVQLYTEAIDAALNAVAEMPECP